MRVEIITIGIVALAGLTVVQSNHRAQDATRQMIDDQNAKARELLQACALPLAPVIDTTLSPGQTIRFTMPGAPPAEGIPPPQSEVECVAPSSLPSPSGSIGGVPYLGDVLKDGVTPPHARAPSPFFLDQGAGALYGPFHANHGTKDLLYGPFHANHGTKDLLYGPFHVNQRPQDMRFPTHPPVIQFPIAEPATLALSLVALALNPISLSYLPSALRRAFFAARRP